MRQLGRLQAAVLAIFQNSSIMWEIEFGLRRLFGEPMKTTGLWTKLVACAFSILASSIAASAQQATIELDVGHQLSGTTYRRSVDESEAVKVAFDNVVPKHRADYRLAIVREAVAEPPTLVGTVTPPAGVVNKVSEILTASGTAYRCNQLAVAVIYLRDVDDEANVAVGVEEVKAAMAAQQADAGCKPDELTALSIYAKSLIDQTSVTADLGELRPGERVTITLSRAVGSASASWSVVADPPPASAWITTIGVVAVSQAFMPERTVFIQTVSGVSTVQTTTRAAFLKIPAIEFAYADRSLERHGLIGTLIGGLALNSNDVAAAFGPGFIFHENLLVSAGIAVHSQTAPLPQYETSGMPAPSGATVDQLTHTRVAVNPYFSISFRLDHNPFGTDTAAH